MKNRALPAARRLLRFVAGLLAASALFGLAQKAARDCPQGPAVYDNCLWIWVRDHLGLPNHPFLRAGTEELAGVAIFAGLYLSARYLLLSRRGGRDS